MKRDYAANGQLLQLQMKGGSWRGLQPTGFPGRREDRRLQLPRDLRLALRCQAEGVAPWWQEAAPHSRLLSLQPLVWLDGVVDRQGGEPEVQGLEAPRACVQRCSLYGLNPRQEMPRDARQNS